MKNLALSLIRLYQKYLSLDQGKLRDWLELPDDFRVCRFSPTCSDYTYQAIEKYGIFTGGLKGFWRILRCNPWTKGGSDPLL